MAIFYGVKRKTGRVDPPHRLPAPRSAAAVEPTQPDEAVDELPKPPAEPGQLEQAPVEPGPVAQALAHVLDHQADDVPPATTEERGSGATQL